MIAHSTKPQHGGSFFSNNYNKTATIPKSACASIRHLPHPHQHQHQSKIATHRKRATRVRSSTCDVLQRALIQHEHHRSRKYARTLDIILEEHHSLDDAYAATPHEPRFRQPLAPFGDCGDFETEETALISTMDASRQACSNNNSVIATDFWHSTRSMKKSVTSISLDSLVLDANNEGDDGIVCDSSTITSSNDENVLPNLVLADKDDIDFDCDIDYENFLDDWDL